MKDLSARFYDLEAQQFADGTVRLTQQSGIDEPSVIDLHPQQLQHLAKKIGLIEPERISRSVERMLWRLYEDAGKLADYLMAQMSFPPQDGLTRDQEMASVLFDDIENLLSELGLMTDGDDDETPEPSPPIEKPPKRYQQGDLLGDAS